MRIRNIVFFQKDTVNKKLVNNKFASIVQGIELGSSKAKITVQVGVGVLLALQVNITKGKIK